MFFDSWGSGIVRISHGSVVKVMGLASSNLGSTPAGTHRTLRRQWAGHTTEILPCRNDVLPIMGGMSKPLNKGVNVAKFGHYSGIVWQHTEANKAGHRCRKKEAEVITETIFLSREGVSLKHITDHNTTPDSISSHRVSFKEIDAD